MILRGYTPNDCKTLAELFFNTVHISNIKDYSEEQINVWATGHIDLEQWNRSFLSHYTVIAEINGTVVGFGDIDNTGYLDRLYVHADFQRQGIATAICDKLEQASHAEKIVTHASITAKGFFEKRGYKVVAKQQVQRQGILLTNYVMER
ncbi:MAG: GNAT family N-acetyltransferase [Oscillospiraceae bacterium]|nr:GNAT family N-acetyltransferase [Oscillospiraceae bacterium]